MRCSDGGGPVRVNSVHPGFVETPLLHQGMERWAQRDGGTAAEKIEAMAQTTPVKRLAQPIKIGRVVAAYT